MNLGDLVRMAEEQAEDWAEFRVIIAASSDDYHVKVTGDVTVKFDVEKGTMTIEESN